MKHQYDVVIIGAGLAGLRAAIELGEGQHVDHGEEQTEPGRHRNGIERQSRVRWKIGPETHF